MVLKDEDGIFDETLSHEQIWDDSTLIAAWEATVNEYKTYHSQIDNDNDDPEIQFPHIPDSNSQSCIGIESSKENLNEFHSDGIFDIQKEIETEDSQKKLVDELMNSASIALPFQIFNNDQPLKDLLMSWYYAGYYTGYYMGQDSINKRNQE
ncbi:hypothetical protein PMAC_001244 [Pneumocystis sp. 'macacae']|nr:hypothetical protein PMAC_001244 [Pneumocystis sp. 'macacae']